MKIDLYIPRSKEEINYHVRLTRDEIVIMEVNGLSSEVDRGYTKWIVNFKVDDKAPAAYKTDMIEGLLHRKIGEVVNLTRAHLDTLLQKGEVLVPLLEEGRHCYLSTHL